MFTSLSTLTRALTNIFIFLPYYFSVDMLIRTLFEPWKRVVSRERRVGFSFSDYFNDLAFEWVSRGVGCVIRLATLTTYLLVQILYVPVALAVFVVYLVFIAPLQIIIRRLTPSPAQRLMDLKQEFITQHTDDPSHVPAVEQWFDTWHDRTTHAGKWWELDNLLNSVPLGRDWAQGYTPVLDQYVTDLSGIAQRHDDRPMTIGRETELKQIEDVLCKSQGANILMVGEEGVGKTTIIESLAYRIYIGRGNPLLAFKRLVEINLEKVLATDRDPKVRESILEELLDEADRAGNIIFVIFNFDRYMSSGESRVDLSTPLERFVRSNRIHMIAVTTPFAYQKYLYNRPVIKTHFTLLQVPEITAQTTLQIMLEHAHRFESRYHVHITYEALLAAVQKSEYFISDIPFPEKALMVIDECCNRAKDTAPSRGQISRITPQDVDQVLSTKTHVPTTLTEQFKTKLLTIYDALCHDVIGQKVALGELSATLQRSFLMIGKRKKPLATFLFLGPTGVGKTETAKVLARVFFEGASTLIRFDMSQYQRVEDIPKLIGDTDQGDPGLLVSAIRERPYGVLLLDEIEKAHHDLLNIFLTVLDEGYIADSAGKHVDCRSLVVIATSNAGALEFHQYASPSAPDTGDSSGGTAPHPYRDVMSFLIEKRYFTPEFLNRFDGVIAFAPLSPETAYQIAKLMIARIQSSISQLHGVSITVQDSSIRDIISREFNPQYGARDLERALRSRVEDVVAQRILRNEVVSGGRVEI